jgi:GAF domain-containing protein
LSLQEREALVQAGQKSVLDAPLRVGFEVFGVLSLIESRSVRTFSTAERDLLVQLCGLAAILTRNTHLLREREERTLHMQLLQDVSRAVTSSLVLEDVLRAVCQYTGQAMQVSSCDIQLYDSQFDVLVYAACWDSDPTTRATLLGAIVDPDERPSNRMALEGTPNECHIDDADLPAAEREGLERWGEKTTLDFPLVYQDKTIGILGLIERDLVRRFTFEERTLFEQLGLLASIANHNAQVLESLEASSSHLEAMLTISGLWATAADIDEILDGIVGACALALRAERELLCTLGDGGRLVLRAAHPAQSGGRESRGAPLPAHRATALQRALDNGFPLLERVSDARLDSVARAALDTWGVRSCLTVPLRSSGETVGALILTDTASERLYGSSELELAVAAGHQAAAALRIAAADSSECDGRRSKGARPFFAGPGRRPAGDEVKEEDHQ